MYVHAEKKLIYLAHPRTASSSTADALMKIGFGMCGQKGHHMTLQPKVLVGRYGVPREEWTAFTTVRNHWDIAVSFAWTRNDVQKTLPFTVEHFKEALGHAWYRTEHEMFALHVEDADIILRFEGIQDNLNTFLTRRGLGPVALPHIHEEWSEKRGGPGYRRFYTDETRAYIADKFYDEIAKFGYTF